MILVTGNMSVNFTGTFNPKKKAYIIDIYSSD